MPGYYTTMSTLDAMQLGRQATISNVGNISINGYKARHVALQSGPYDQSVRVGRIYSNTVEAAAVVVSAVDNQIAEDRTSLFSWEDDRKCEEIYAAIKGQSELDITQTMQEREELASIEAAQVELATELSYSARHFSPTATQMSMVRAQEEMTGLFLRMSI